MGTNFLGTICPWGQEVGDRKSGDQMGSGLNELQPRKIIWLYQMNKFIELELFRKRMKCFLQFDKLFSKNSKGSI